MRKGAPFFEGGAFVLLLFGLLASASAAGKPMNPISLHPDNPHYFLFRGKPTVLISSAEHYGALLNLDFDFHPYLKELQSKGLNQTRMFTGGTYLEDPESFNIRNNTLAPAPGRFLCPWKRSDTPGYAGGGNKFDLSRWDDAYFKRLKAYCHAAGEHGVVIEVVLFCPFYEESMWSHSPLKAGNNVNGVGDVTRGEVYTLQHSDLTEIQDRMTRKIVEELKEFDNVYYEICNEPYFGGPTLEWQKHVASVISDAEKSFPHRHLIAQNINNGREKVTDPNPAVSIFNFHYASPPDTVAMNFGLNKVIAFDESGFRGVEDAPYRTEAWEFILAGGGVYSHLDYSYTTAHPDGTAPVTEPTPGGGGPTLRKQYQTLKRFIESFDFLRMAPDESVVKGGVPDGARAYVLAEKGKQYALYLKETEGAALTLEIPAGRYHAEWLDPLTGKTDKPEDVDHPGGSLSLAPPAGLKEIALKLVATGKS